MPLDCCSSVRFPLNGFIGDFGAVLKGLSIYSDAAAGRRLVKPSRGSLPRGGFETSWPGTTLPPESTPGDRPVAEGARLEPGPLVRRPLRLTGELRARAFRRLS